jgi:hypothetical protein
MPLLKPDPTFYPSPKIVTTAPSLVAMSVASFVPRRRL